MNLKLKIGVVLAAFFVLFFSSFFPVNVLAASSFIVNGEEHSMYREFVVDSAMVSGTQAVIPLALSVVQDVGVTSDAGNVRITDANDNPLPREIESFDPATGELMLWFKADVSGVSDTAFKLYFGNMDLTEPAADSAFGSQSVWDSNYVGVWHLKKDYADSTSGGWNGINNGAAISSDGGVFVASEIDYIALNRKSISTGITFEATVTTSNADATPAYPGNAALNVIGDSTNAVWLGFGVENGKSTYNHHDGAWKEVQGTTTINDGNEHHIAVSHYGSSAKLYTDGGLDGSSTITFDASGAAVDRIGAGYNNLDSFDGVITNVLISNIVRSQDYILTRQLCLNNPTATGTNPFYKSISGVNPQGLDAVFEAKQLIHVNPSPDGTLADYQYKISIEHQSPMNSDFSDIRFFTGAGVSMPYWVESKTDGASADVWLKLPVVDVVDGLDVWLYYGNSWIESASDGGAVFEFFDDAESGVFSDKWVNVVGSGGSYSTADVYSGTKSIRIIGDDSIIASINNSEDNAIFEAKVKSTGVNSTFNMLTARASKTEHTYYCFRPHYIPSSGNSQLLKRIDGAWTVLDESSSQGSIETTWANWKIVADGSSIKTHFNDLLLNSATDSFLTSGSIGFRSAGTTSPLYVDEVKIRKYTPNTPTHTISNPVTLDWQLGDWSYRKHIDVSGSPDGDLVDFQVSVNVDFVSGMNDDFSDLRFRTFDGVDVPYWIEEKTDGVSAKVWLKLPLISSETGADVFMYYGNADAVSLSDANAVFDLFDDFEGPALDTSKWAVVGSSGSMSFANSELTVRPATSDVFYGIRSLSAFSSGTVVETKGKNTANRHVAMVGLAESPWKGYPHGDTVTDGFAVYSRVDGSTYVSASYGYGSNTGYGPIYSTNANYYSWKIEFVSSALVKFYRDDALNYTLTNPAYITPNPLNAYLTGDNYYGRGTVVVYDWIRVYKITANKPTLSIGVQEQGTAPFVTSVIINPTIPEAGQQVTATVTATDPQGPGNISSYTFTVKNPEGSVFAGPVTQGGNVYSFVPDAAGLWTVEVTATDGEANTSSVFSEGVSVSGWWNSDWSYRKPITVTDSSGSELTDFQVLVEFDSASLVSSGSMNSDCGDLRFADGLGLIELGYWLESGCNTAATKVWVKVPGIPANGSAGFHMYYGNASAVSASDGDATFDFYDPTDNFADWLRNGNIDYQSLGFAIGDSDSYVMTAVFEDIDSHYVHWVYHGYNDFAVMGNTSCTVYSLIGQDYGGGHNPGGIWYGLNSDFTGITNTNHPARSALYKYVMTKDGSNWNYKCVKVSDGSVFFEGTKTGNRGDLPYIGWRGTYYAIRAVQTHTFGDCMRFRSRRSSDNVADVCYYDMYVRKYASPEPGVSVSAQEQANAPVVTSVSFNLSLFELGDSVIATVTAVDPNEDPITQYDFRVLDGLNSEVLNPAVQSSGSYSFTASGEPGLWQVKVKASDGTFWSSEFTKEVFVNDSSLAVAGLGLSEGTFENTELSEGKVVLSGTQSSGSFTSPAIEPVNFSKWGVVTFSKTTPGSSILTVDVLDASDDSVLLSDIQNGQNVSGLGATAIKLKANFTSGSTPSLDSWDVSYYSQFKITVTDCSAQYLGNVTAEAVRVSDAEEFGPFTGTGGQVFVEVPPGIYNIQACIPANGKCSWKYNVELA